ncbi:MAG: stage III sporulation protein AG [Coprococcus sp.]|nr:stage III sporulation protein AG [Coprococcus sp.]
MHKGGDWKTIFKLHKGKKDQWLILLLMGILLLVIAMPVSKKNESGTLSGESKETESDARQEQSDAAYARQLERRLEEVLQKVEGVGNVSVMITLSSSSEKIVEKDREISSDSSRESAGEAAVSSRSSSSETSVYYGNSGDEIPYVKKEISPEVEGVLVIAQGGGNAVVVGNITEAVQALFGVDTHKIKVMKSK